MWILQASYGETWVSLYVEVIDWLYYITIYGGYGVMWLLVFLSTFVLPAANVNTGFPFGQGGQGFGLVFAYMLVVGVDLFVQIFFETKLAKWDAINKTLMAKKSTNEAEKKRRKELGLSEDPNEETDYGDGEDDEVDEMNEEGDDPFDEDDLEEEGEGGFSRPTRPSRPARPARPTVPIEPEDDDSGWEEADEENIDPWGETNF